MTIHLMLQMILLLTCSKAVTSLEDTKGVNILVWGLFLLMEKYIKKIVVPGYIWEHWKDVDKCLYAIH